MATKRGQAIRDTVREDGNESHTTNGEDILTCEVCGHTGADVSRHYGWVGGRGDMPSMVCDDRQACWRRFGINGQPEKVAVC